MTRTSHISVPVETAQFLRLAEFLKKQNSEADPVDVIANAINYWMDNADWKPELLPDTIVREAERGYTWKDLFLPNGTVVRMRYKGEFFYARVEGDYLVYKGERSSPSELVNKVTGTSRNAWRDIWIKRPGEPDFRLADDLRRGSSSAVTLEDLGL